MKPKEIWYLVWIIPTTCFLIQETRGPWGIVALLAMLCEQSFKCFVFIFSSAGHCLNNMRKNMSIIVPSQFCENLSQSSGKVVTKKYFFYLFYPWQLSNYYTESRSVWTTLRTMPESFQQIRHIWPTGFRVEVSHSNKMYSNRHMHMWQFVILYEILSLD